MHAPWNEQVWTAGMYKAERAIHNTTIFVSTREQQHRILQGANTGENFYTLKLLLIAAINFSDFSEKPHN